MHIYGPVPSWRLGASLGVDVVDAPEGFDKICSFNCRYCQLGARCFCVSRPQSMGFAATALDELKKKVQETNPDIITFSGCGEPSLNLDLGRIAADIKQKTDLPVAVLTNSSLVHLPEVRANLANCDLVIAKLDAGNDELMQKVNRPALAIRVADIVKNLQKINSKVAIQTLLFSTPDWTNADSGAIASLLEVYEELYSDSIKQVFLGTAYRPGSPDVSALPESELERIAYTIEQKTGMEVVFYQKNKARIRETRTQASIGQIRQAVIDLLRRRPCTSEELRNEFGKQANMIVKQMEQEGRAVSIEKSGNKYYQIY